MNEPLNDQELTDAKALLDNEEFWDMVAERWGGPARESGSRLFATIARLQERLEEAEEIFVMRGGDEGASSEFTQVGIIVDDLHGASSKYVARANHDGIPDAVRDFLGIPKTKKLIIGISMGYPDLEAKLNTYHSTRVGLDDFVKWHA